MTEKIGTRDQSRIARSTLTVIAAFAVAKVISLAQTFIIAQTFGVGTAYDTYVTANRAPELIVTLIAGGALGYAFIPIFTGLLAIDKRKRAWEVASHVINTVFVVTLAITVLAFIGAPWLVSTVYAPGFDAETQAQTVILLRILLLSTLIFSVSGIVMGILQSHNHFLMPALAPIMYDIGILIGVLFLLEPMGIYGVAWGAVLGAALHLAVQIPGLVRYRARWTPRLGLNDPTLWQVIRLMLPRVAGIGVFYLNFALMNNLASRMGEGSVSALGWGWQLTQIPQTLLGTALGIVMFPTLAQLSEVGDEEGKRNAMSGALRFMLITTIPAAVGMIVVGRPLISILEGGVFDASATNLVYDALRFFALSIIVMSILEIAARSFYADKDTVTPLWAALAGASVNAVLAIVLSGLWFTTGTPFDLGVGGLGLALSLGVAVEISILLLILRKRWHWSLADSLGSTLTKTLTASAVMAAGVAAVGMGWDVAGLTGQGRLLTLAQVGLMTSTGVIIFGVMAVILGMTEIRDLFLVMLRRRKPKEALT